MALLREQRFVFTECFGTVDPVLFGYTARVKARLDSNVNPLVPIRGERGWRKGCSDVLQCFECKIEAKRQDVSHAP